MNSGLQAQNNLHTKGSTARTIIPGSHQDDRRRTNGYQSFQGFLEEIQGLGLGERTKMRDRPGLKDVFDMNVIQCFEKIFAVYLVYTLQYIHMFYIAIYMVLDPDVS